MAQNHLRTSKYSTIEAQQIDGQKSCYLIKYMSLRNQINLNFFYDI